MAGNAGGLNTSEALLEFRTRIASLSLHLKRAICFIAVSFSAFCFSSQSDTDLAIYGDGKQMSDFEQSGKAPEEPMLGSISLLHCSYDIIKIAWHQIF